MRLIYTDSLRLHPQVDCVPSMTAEQFASLKFDIAERGIRVPIEIIDGGVILDGRSRWLAAKELEIPQVPVVNASLGEDDPVVYMLRAAIQRRHLMPDQLVCLALEEMELSVTASRQERAIAGGTAGGRGRPKKNDNSSATTLDTEVIAAPSTDSRDVRSVISEKYGVSHRRLRYAQTLRRDDTRLYERVRIGSQRLLDAKRILDREKLQREYFAIAPDKINNSDLSPWEIRCGDCLVELRKIETGSVRLVFADPPYNIGVDYGDGTDADSFSDDDYLKWCNEWIVECVRILSGDGSLWVMINDEYADHFGLLLRNSGLMRRSWIKWYETFGVNCSNNFNRCSRHIFYCVKNPKQFVFNPAAVIRSSDRQAKYADKRASPSGKLWDNVWCIPRLVGTSSERIPGFPTQLPLQLVRAIVGCASQPGDLIVDPFSGSGTTGESAIIEHRRFIGIEKNPAYAAASRERLTKTIRNQ